MISFGKAMDILVELGEREERWGVRPRGSI